MNVKNVISLVRAQTGASVNTIDDSQILDYVNLVYHDIENMVGQIDQNYFYDSFFTDMLSGQSEYLLPNIKKIIGVYAKYSADKDFYVKLEEMDFGNLSEDISYYQNYQSALDPFYLVGDNSIFICPNPSETIENGLKVDGIVSLDDLTLDSTESDIKIHKNYHGVLIMGVKVYVYGALGMGSEKRDAKQDYEDAKSDMSNELSQRIVSPVEGQSINLEMFA